MKKAYSILLCISIATLCACTPSKDSTSNSVSSSQVSTSITSNNSISNNSSLSSSTSTSGSSSSVTSSVSSNDVELPPIPVDNYHKSNEFNGICKENIIRLGKVNRKLPETKNEGLASYPQYGKNFENTSLYDAIYNENNLLIASDSTYDSMDKDGNLYLNGASINKKLYKHSSSVGLYGGDVLDTEEAYIKKIQISPRKLGNYITGCYAPAGEVITVTVSEETLEKNPNLKIIIGQSAQSGSNNSIPVNTTLTRMPNITNVMNIKSETTYVGSYFGGPIYVDGIESNNKSIELTISGGVDYACLLYGNTTKEEYEISKNSSAPYFDLEVYDKSVRHSGLKKEAANYSYEDLIKAAKLWKTLPAYLTKSQVEVTKTLVLLSYTTLM